MLNSPNFNEIRRRGFLCLLIAFLSLWGFLWASGAILTKADSDLRVFLPVVVNPLDFYSCEWADASSAIGSIVIEGNACQLKTVPAHLAPTPAPIDDFTVIGD